MQVEPSQQPPKQEEGQEQKQQDPFDFDPDNTDLAELNRIHLFLIKDIEEKGGLSKMTTDQINRLQKLDLAREKQKGSNKNYSDAIKSTNVDLPDDIYTKIEDVPAGEDNKVFNNFVGANKKLILQREKKIDEQESLIVKMQKQLDEANQKNKFFNEKLNRPTVKTSSNTTTNKPKETQQNTDENNKKRPNPFASESFQRIFEPSNKQQKNKENDNASNSKKKQDNNNDDETGVKLLIPNPQDRLSNITTHNHWMSQFKSSTNDGIQFDEAEMSIIGNLLNSPSKPKIDQVSFK